MERDVAAAQRFCEVFRGSPEELAARGQDALPYFAHGKLFAPINVLSATPPAM